METQDAQALSYSDETFDRIFSVSVVEHIPGNGDAVAVQEIARVLKPGGIVCLTVPWSDRGYLEEFHAPSPSAYWVKSSDQARVFYQRAYDHDSLHERLLSHRCLDLVDVSFWGERRIAVEDALLNPRLPRSIRYAMLPAHFVLNRLFLSPLAETECSRKKVACVTLRKRELRRQGAYGFASNRMVPAVAVIRLPEASVPVKTDSAECSALVVLHHLVLSVTCCPAGTTTLRSLRSLTLTLSKKSTRRVNVSVEPPVSKRTNS